MKDSVMAKDVVLYDGVCLFCEGWVNFVINNSKISNCPVFIPLQFVDLSDEITSILEKVKGGGDSIIFLSKSGNIFVKSDASLEVMAGLKAPYNFLAHLSKLVPRFVRNRVYDLVGRNRYKIWGKRDFCALPQGDRKALFPTKRQELIDVTGSESFQSFFEFKDAT
jgi:predicted DCC family thiol-disulfide oxidoreductase YuxK